MIKALNVITQLSVIYLIIVTRFMRYLPISSYFLLSLNATHYTLVLHMYVKTSGVS